MFTGIIETIGLVREARPERGGLSLVIDATFGDEPLRIGESVAVSGPCLTVEKVLPGGFRTFASSETLRRTTLGRTAAGRRVNLERALRVGGRLGGHIVTGHIDGVGRCRRISTSGTARELVVEAPDEVRRFLATKGSVAIDGASLTVNEVRGAEFSVMIIPHTLAATTLEAIVGGSEVNLEADVIARYVAVLAGGAGSGGLTEARLRELGFLGDTGGTGG
jgi:riboflavin synthase